MGGIGNLYVLRSLLGFYERWIQVHTLRHAVEDH